MANVPQYIKDLARQSGKNETFVSTTIDNVEKELVKSPQKIALDKTTDADREKKYEAYWGAVMLKVRQKIGMPNAKINIPECAMTKKKKKIEEDGEGAVAAVTTSSMGGTTTATGEKAPYGSSAIFAQRMSMTSRAGSVGMPVPMKKKKKKKVSESVEYIDNIIDEVYYRSMDRRRYSGSASPSSRMFRSKEYWDEPNEEHMQRKPKCPVGYYFDEATKAFKIRRQLKSPYIQYAGLDNAGLDKDLEATYPTKEDANKGCSELLNKYFPGYLEDEKAWRHSEDMYR